MHIMSETNRNPVIRVYPHTRTKLKVQAAQHEMTMQDYVEWLVTEQEKRERGKDATGRTTPHQAH
jgi:hypothetical protein